MSLAATQARLQMVVARTSDVTIQGQFINQARMQLANVVGAMWSVTANLEPESGPAQAIQAQIASIQSQDKTLETSLARLDTQLKALNTEREALQKQVDKQISFSFKTFGQ